MLSMRVIINGDPIHCPICQKDEFVVNENVRIQGTKRNDYEDELHTIFKDEAICENCGWTGFFENEYDLYGSVRKITYEG